MFSINRISSTVTATALSFLIIFTATASGGFQFDKRIKKSDNLSDVEKHSESALKAGTNSQYINLMKANIDTAEMLCQKENIEMPAILHLARAEYFFLTGDFNHASKEGVIALRLAEETDATMVHAKALNFLGKYNLRTGFYSESLDYFRKSLELSEKYKLKGILPVTYDKMKSVYDALGNLKEFRNTIVKLINAALSENDTLMLENGYYLLGTSLTNEERDFQAADSLLKKCYELALIRKDSAYLSLSLANMGWNFYVEKKYNLAINSYNKSLNYSIPLRRFADAANALGNLGTIYRDLGDTERSITFYKQAIRQGKQVNDYYNLSWVYQDMSEMYLRKQDTANAFKNFVLFKNYSDTLIKSNNTLGMANTKIRYEADSQNKEIELLSFKIRNQRLLIYGYSGLFLLSLAIGILIISRAKINEKHRISDMNHKISEITQANLRQQMNPHFIFNTLNSIQYYMYQHDKLATNNYLTKFSSLMRKVLENSQHTSIPLRDELDALNLYLELEKIRFKDKFEYTIKIDEEIDIILFKVPTMLIQPYVENSICHGLMPREEKGLVKIDLELKKDYISCIIEDNGIGRDAANGNMMKSGINHNSLGTRIVSSRLDLVNTLYGTNLKTVYTDLKNVNGEPEGTRVEIHIPILT
jgi:tetratricopeptide (TPR) repeat protein